MSAGRSLGNQSTGVGCWKMAGWRQIYLSCLVIHVMLHVEAFGQTCQVDNLNVQSDFDFEKYMGKWYEISWYSDIVFPRSTWLTDYTHNYVQTEEDTSTVYAQGRYPQNPTRCYYAASTLATTSTPGKLLFTSDGSTIPYWVLETDYTQYAFVYGCYNISMSGICSGARAWIFSRTPTLPESVRTKTSSFHQNICIQSTSFESVAFNKECDLKTHWKLQEDQDCTVSTFDVQENFNISRYAGTWYETRWLAPVSIPANQVLQDYQHRYVITGDGNITGYLYGRSPDDPDQCFNFGVSLLQTSTPGKFMFKTKSSPAIPYWVIRTDYTQYAVVYGCSNESSDGSCNEASSWVWSRTPTLPTNLEYEVNVLLQNICVNPSAYLSTEQNVSCPLKPLWNLHDQFDCKVDNFDIQSNFDISMYAGTWYETRWLAPFSIPANELFQDYQHHYVITGDGNITGYIYGRSPDDPDLCFHYDITLQQTSTPGKLLFKYKNDPPIPYWVIRTDYTQYAVVFSCYNVSSNGSCYQARSWVWSRTPTLPKNLEYDVNTLLQNICVNPAAYLTTEQEQLCPVEPVWKLYGQQDCNVTSFKVKANFDAKLFTRMWYVTRWLPTESPSQPESFTDRTEELYRDDKGDLKSYTRHRKGDMCTYGTTVYKKTTIPGKFTVVTQDSYGYWVADTDYENYAVMYGCERVASDGGCLSARGSVWSRAPTLPPSIQYKANSVLQEFCINPSALTETLHDEACPPQLVKGCTDPVSSTTALRPHFVAMIVFVISLTLIKA